MKGLLFFLCILLLPQSVNTPVQSVVLGDSMLSDKTINYRMDLVLDEQNHQARGSSEIIWINRSPESVENVRLHMYLNAFSDRKSSYLREGRGIGADPAAERPAEDWGWVKVMSARQGDSTELQQRYIAPTDGNEDDKSVLEILLDEPVYGGDTLTLQLEFESKLPRIFGRSGFAEHGFMHWVHWYPKLGVYEEDDDGSWGWNCHQFLPQMEFYGEHGNYAVSIDGPSGWTIGGSGHLSVEDKGEGRSKYQFFAHDVIDFGWVASPHLQVKNHRWEDVKIRLLYPSSHRGHTDRLMHATTFGLDYMKKYVGEYPYPTLTILDPPVYGLRSGFMEYPTYITGGSFYAWPKQIRTIESLILHEFAHQYFMQLLASNEKEEPWLDEGFATYYEDRVMEAMLGEKSSLFDVFGYHVSNSDFTRNEYVSIAETKTDPIATRSWEIEGPYKAIIYSKTATFLKTVEHYLGRSAFDEMMQEYFREFVFSNPRGEDFVQLLRNTCRKEGGIFSAFADVFIQEAIYGTGTCDYSVAGVEQSKESTGYQQRIRLENRGELKIPVQVVVRFEDGVDEIIEWNGQDDHYEIELSGHGFIRSVEIDPHKMNLLDIDFNNNSWTEKPAKLGRVKYSAKFAFWFQQLTNTLSVLL